MKKLINSKYGLLLAFGLTSIVVQCSTAAVAASTVKKQTVWKDQVEKTESRVWKPLIAFSAGAAFSDKIGRSQFIPIRDPIEDQFFSYAADHSTQSKFIYGASLGIEFLLNPKWFLQTNVSYYQPMKFHAHGIVTQGADALSADSFSYTYDIQVRQVLFESKLLYNWLYRSMSFYPYVSAGIGVGLNSARNYNVNIVPPFTTFSNQFTNETNTSFSYKVGLGVDYEVANHVRVGVGYRFADFGRVKLGNASINQIPTLNNLSQSHLYTNEILGQITVVI